MPGPGSADRWTRVTLGQRSGRRSVLAGSPPLADLPHVQKLQAEIPDPLQQPVQAGLVELGTECRDAAVPGEVEARERIDRLGVEFADDPDLVALQHGGSLVEFVPGDCAHRLLDPSSAWSEVVFSDRFPAARGRWIMPGG